MKSYQPTTLWLHVKQQGLSLYCWVNSRYHLRRSVNQSKPVLPGLCK